jgi:hypothetical protein
MRKVAEEEPVVVPVQAAEQLRQARQDRLRLEQALWGALGAARQTPESVGGHLRAR